MCVEYKERKKGEHDASQNHETARWAHVHGKVHARAQERERKRERAHISSPLPISPGFAHHYTVISKLSNWIVGGPSVQ